MPGHAAQHSLRRFHSCNTESSCISPCGFTTLRDFCVMDGTSAHKLFPQVSLSGHYAKHDPASLDGFAFPNALQPC